MTPTRQRTLSHELAADETPAQQTMPKRMGEHRRAQQYIYIYATRGQLEYLLDAALRSSSCPGASETLRGCTAGPKLSREAQ